MSCHSLLWVHHHLFAVFCCYGYLKHATKTRQKPFKINLMRTAMAKKKSSWTEELQRFHYFLDIHLKAVDFFLFDLVGRIYSCNIYPQRCNISASCSSKNVHFQLHCQRCKHSLFHVLLNQSTFVLLSLPVFSFVIKRREKSHNILHYFCHQAKLDSLKSIKHSRYYSSAEEPQWEMGKVPPPTFH